MHALTRAVAAFAGSSMSVLSSFAGEPPIKDGPMAVENAGDTYTWGECKIDTPLPEGYPAPTAPGAIEVKSYPLVRRAEVRGSQSPDLGMNIAFWPLFNHIKKHDIAMTSPVEMDYRGLTTAAQPSAPSGQDVAAQPPELEWTMAFLYRTPGMNELGAEGAVEVVDAAARTVVAIGFKGAYSTAQVRARVAELEAWLSMSAEWERDGDPRALYYNGPDTPTRHQWGEVQIPVRRKDDAAVPFLTTRPSV